MRKPVLLYATGIALIGIALLWFFTPLSESFTAMGTEDGSLRGEEASTLASWIGNIANLFFAALGTYFNYLGYRISKPGKG